MEELNLMDTNSLANDIRKLSLKSIHAARSGHPGGSFSIAEMLAILYFEEMNLRPDEPRWADRDRFILSKGHACPALYAALALKGYFPESDCLGLRKIESYLEGHPDVRTPGIDAASGSLGMGLSQGMGYAMGAKHQGKDFRTYVLLGDGDMQEGNTWEALMCAAHHNLDNLVAIYDANLLQGDDFVENQMNMHPMDEKIKSFGWEFIEIDGHDVEAIRGALKTAKATKGKPTFILANTVKGKGVSFMENIQFWHGSVTMTDEQLNDALKEL